MSIRDRGKIKWRAASFLSLAFEMQREMFKDQERQIKPIIDENEAEKFDQDIALAMEFTLEIMLTLWEKGFTKEIYGRIHNLAPINHQLHVEIEPRVYEKISFEDVIGVVVVD
ncbi:YolD-like family protein [Neobacillus niacini]|uniref:YolD-like family protein n=1 Tax=Neobacillus niacini TaxID=86668 RepID=UPI00203B580F|nr:YolD-like family protein [Neobacillus niacini]MCM3692183.1 YolD-like family protein [Neobacillus niacini]